MAFILGFAVAWMAPSATSTGPVLTGQSSPVVSPAAVNDTKVTAAAADPSPATVGTPINITATVWNMGDTVAMVQVNATAVNESSGKRFVDAKNVTIPANQNVSVWFIWNTNAFPPGTYAITVETALLPGETDPTDNTFDAPPVELLAPGPLNVTARSNFAATDVGKTITFVCQASGGVLPYRFSWNFGDNSRTNESDFTFHAYSTPGVKTATCTVRDNSGARAVSQVTMVIAPIPTVIATVDRSSASPGTTLTFTALTSGGTGAISYLWAFGDGSPTGVTNPIPHKYNQAGQYTVELTVFDSVDGRRTTSLIVSISPLMVTAFQSATSINQDDTVAFSAFATGGAGDPYTFLWDFGDTQSSTEPTAYHKYTAPATYTPSVKVTDAVGTETTHRLSPIVVGGPGLTPSSGPPYFQVGIGAVAAVAVAVGTTVAVRRDRRRKRWGPRPR